MTIGDRIRKERELADISQTDLAEKIKISKQTLYKYEKNIITNIPSDKIEAIAKALNISESYLMGWSEEKGDEATSDLGNDEDLYKRTFSKNLKKYMYLKSKTQSDLINDLGFNKSAVSTWCSGSRLPRMDKVQMLADYFGIEKSDLLEEKIATPMDYLDTATLKQLNRTNIDKVNVYSRNLLNIQNMEDNSFDVIAAHERTDTNITNEMIEHDNDIMDDDNF